MDDPNEPITVRDAAAATLQQTIMEGPVLFGRYRTIRELGRGGMGVVLLAQDTVLDVTVALKLIPETVVRDTEGIVDLKKEVLRGMELTHPGIVRVFSFEQDSTTAAIVMEHIQGETLAQKKAERPNRCFDCDEVLPWLEQLCAALDYAHSEARIAHRDLKPGNLMLTSGGRLKVADFGIASSLSDTMSRVSVRADSSGTPPYMSPQQAMGERPTHLDDLYSLGATLYELLTSKPPFFRGNILAQVMHEEPARMAQRRLELSVTGDAPIPESWEKMVAACLAKRPEDRPGSGAAILSILKNPERALMISPAVSVEDMRLDVVVASEPIVRVHPRPVQGGYPEPEEWKTVRPVERTFSLKPALSFCATMITGSFEAVLAVLRPLTKIAIAVALLWSFLHLKEKWDAGKARRDAVAASTAQRRGSESEAAPNAHRVHQTYYPPAAPHDARPGPGSGPNPFPHRPPPPPPRR